MPLYVYENDKGETVELIRSVEDRDCAPPGYRRQTVPQVVGVMTGVLDPESADRAVPTALRNLESTVPAREIARQAGFTVNQLKETWAI